MERPTEISTPLEPTPVTKPSSSATRPGTASESFKVGQEIVYYPNGRYRVADLIMRTIGTSTEPYYKLLKINNPFSGATKSDLAVWVPVRTATQLGLRLPLTQDHLVAITEILAAKELPWDLQITYEQALAKIQTEIRVSGLDGLARAYACLHTRTKYDTHAPREVTQLLELVAKTLFREIADLTDETIAAARGRLNKTIKPKLN